MSAAAWTTLAIVLGAIAMFASEKVRIDLVALIVLVLLVTLGLVTPTEALAGFSNEATITVAAMFALSIGIERSGALDPLGRVLSRIRQPWLLTLALMMVVVYVTRIAGYWLIGRLVIGRRLRRMLDALPGAIIAATVAPALVQGGPRALLAMAATLVVMIVVRKDFFAVLAGVAVAAAAFAYGL